MKEIKFISFNSGICNIFYIDENGIKTPKYNSLGFQNKVLGFKRYYEASAINKEISKVITIPFLNKIDTYDEVEIIGDGIYTIELIQEKEETYPKSMDLTLSKVKK